MLNLRVSSKKQAKIKLALQGCAGSGKTYSALLLAYGLTNDWTKIAIIDSENGSADLYASLGNYNVLPLQDGSIDRRKIGKPASMRRSPIINVHDMDTIRFPGTNGTRGDGSLVYLRIRLTACTYLKRLTIGIKQH